MVDRLDLLHNYIVVERCDLVIDTISSDNELGYSSKVVPLDVVSGWESIKFSCGTTAIPLSEENLEASTIGYFDPFKPRKIREAGN